jgi:hypothetical protein
MSCVGLTNKLHRCKKSATCNIECYGISLKVCNQHMNTNPIYLWSYNFYNIEIPPRIKKYLEFYNDIRFYHRDIGKWLAVMVTSELYETESSKLSRRRLLGKFYDRVLTPIKDNTTECPVCMEHGDLVSTNCEHVFCNNCIRTWLDKKPSCPLCRNLILSYSK